MNKNYDFGGYVTKYNLKCADGRTILPDAFKDDDGKKVPLVWNHCHDTVNNVLGHVILRHRADGIYGEGYLNDTEQGKAARILVKNGDIGAMSIYANKLSQTPNRGVMHGEIKEVSLVLAPANPGALIDTVLAHGEMTDDELFATPGEEIVYGEAIAHAEETPEAKPEEKPAEELEHAEEKADDKKEEPKVADKEKTVKDVVDTMNEEQKKVLEFLVGEAAILAKEGKLNEELANADENEKEENKGGESMKHNLFEAEESNEDVLTHDEMKAILEDAHQYGSLKKSALMHGITNVTDLFPEAKNITTPPVWVRRDDSWVKVVMDGVGKSPFSRIKTMYADLTEADARAKGYIKGNLKKEQFFAVFRRKTDPTTVYKKQKMDRDDVVDITDFDVINWLKGEMRFMLEEEIARAILFGDGRTPGTEDKIDEERIRPVWTDNDIYTIKYPIAVAAAATDDDKAKAFIKGAVKSRKNYKGAGNPIMFMSVDMHTACLLLEDNIGHRIYKSDEELKTALRASRIIDVPQMENMTRVVDGVTYYLAGLYLNLSDYRVGADKGGAATMFDDFDLDYNKMIYLIETRCSGALIQPYSAVALELVFNNSLEVEPEDPETTILGYKAKVYQSGVAVNDTYIEGTLHYAENVTEFSGDPELQEGNYLALKVDFPEGSTATVELINAVVRPGPVPFDEDKNCLLRITDKDVQKVKLVSTGADGTVITKVYSLKSLKLEPKAD